MKNIHDEVKNMTDRQLNDALVAMANVLMQGMGRQSTKSVKMPKNSGLQ